MTFRFDPPPGIIWQAPTSSAVPEMRKTIILRETVPVPACRYIEPKSNVGPRGGDDRFRAAAKAARKARQNQRKRK